MMYLLQMIPISMLIAPFGAAGIAVFFGLAALRGPGKAKGERGEAASERGKEAASETGETSFLGFKFKGNVRFGLIVLAIIFACVALQETGPKPPPPMPRPIDDPKPEYEELALRFLLNALESN